MLKPLTLALTFAFTAVSQADTDANVKVREGKLTKLEMSSEVERQVIKPDLTDETVKKAPEQGFQYAVVTIKLAAGRSIGLYDYALKPVDGKGSFNAIGMSVDGGPFKARVWEVRASGGKVEWVGIHDQNVPEFRKGSEQVDAGTVIRLLYEVPEGNKRFKMVSRLLTKSLNKEYSVKSILDFDDMSGAAAAAPEEDEAPSKEKEEKTEN